MSEKPILFSGEMVRAILDGRKTQTRRIVKVQPANENAKMWHSQILNRRDPQKTAYWRTDDDSYESEHFKKPFEVGDRLWVRETWGYGGTSSQGSRHYATVRYWADGEQRDVYFKSFKKMMDSTPKQNLKYPADYEEFNDWDKSLIKDDLLHAWWQRQKKKPSIFMPRWASRITLEVVAVRVERLQDISEDDAIAEGCPYGQTSDFNYERGDAQTWFSAKWEEINGKRAPWASNCWVWVIEFKKV